MTKKMKTDEGKVNEDKDQNQKGKTIVLEVHRPMHLHKTKPLPEED